MEYRLGLDIGVASVGWCLVDNEDEIIKAGVRIFPEGKSDENQKRRERRGARRLLRRRQQRLENLKNLLLEYKIIDKKEYDFYTNDTTPYHLRKKGLTEKLTKRELAIALLHLGKRRGAGDFSIETNSKEEEGTKAILAKNALELSKGKYICEIQLERLENGVRGTENNFKTIDYVNEGKKIIQVQQEFYPELDKIFLEKFLGILDKRRKYYEGPGQNSPYSWKSQEEWMEGLLGNCTYYPDELRMVKNSYTAELFNILNDLNNLKLKREENDKITYEEKLELIEVFKKTRKVSLGKIAKTLGIEENSITGYRIDKKENAVFSAFDSYIDINKIIKCDDREILDEISKIATYYQDTQTKIEKFGELLRDRSDITGTMMEELAKLNYSGSHSLSKKAMLSVEKELLETSKNQMEIFEEIGLKPYKMDFSSDKIKYIPKNYVDKWVLSPTVKRSMIQSINVINEILKRYGVPNEIVIEMAREKNSEEKRKKILDGQKKNEEENKKITELLENRKLDKKYLELLKYWRSQDGICMYSGEKISIDRVINNPEEFEIDHIIPRSISFDNSQDNKVFVKRIENQNKGQRSPFGYFCSGQTTRKYEEFKKQVLNMRGNGLISIKKRDLLLLEEEISKYTREFIARNLVDTRYATRELLNLLKVFFRDKKYDVKIKAIKGSMTAEIRKQWRLSKIREVNHNHHAQDAYIVLMAQKFLNKLKWVKNSELSKEEKLFLGENEILDDKAFKELFDYRYSKKIREYKDFTYSHMVDKKPNRQLSDETIYSTRKFGEDEYVIGKIKNIYDNKSKVVDKLKKSPEDFLIYHNDKKTYELIEKIIKEYDKKGENPFYNYYKEHGYIRKYSKDGNGPIIKNLKYMDHKLGNYLDITHKYNTKDKKVIMEKIPSYRADIYYNGEEYKFVSVRYIMLKDKGEYYEIDMKKYQENKKIKEIDDSYEYQFSLHTGEIFTITDDNGEKEKLRFKGIKDDIRKVLEVDDIHRGYAGFIRKLKEIAELKKKDTNYDYIKDLSIAYGTELTEEEAENIVSKLPSDRKVITLGKKVKNITKNYVNILGQEYTSKEKFDIKIKK